MSAIMSAAPAPAPAPAPMTIHVKMLSGDILPLVVTVDMSAIRVYRALRDALPMELRPWAFHQLSLFSCRKENAEPIPIDRKPFQAEDGESFLLVIRPNRWNMNLRFIQNTIGQDGTPYEQWYLRVEKEEDEPLTTWSTDIVVDSSNRCVDLRDFRWVWPANDHQVVSNPRFSSLEEAFRVFVTKRMTEYTEIIDELWQTFLELLDVE
jgi:hypothetical protein